MPLPLSLLAAASVGAVVGGGGVAAILRRRARRNGDGSRGAVAVVAIDRIETIRANHGTDVVERLLARVEDILRRALPGDATITQPRRRGRYHAVLPGHGGTEARLRLALALRAVRLVTVEAAGARVPTVAHGAVAEIGGTTAMAALARAEADLVAEDGTVTDLRDGLHYHLQPIRRLDGNGVVGFEALIRWDRAGPGGAGRVADMIDRIPDGTPSVFADRAIAAARAVLDRPERPFVSFNVGAGTLERSNGDGGQWLRRVLDALPPDRVMLELLEGAVPVQPDRLASGLRALRERGVRLALDDFGTALSNLDRLVALRPDVVKIDRTFCTGARTARLPVVAALAAMAARLDVTLVAEGMETDADVGAMRDLGVPLGQGFHLGRPAPASAWSVGPIEGSSAEPA